MYPGLFNRYQRKGRDWLRRIDAESRRVFAQIGYVSVGRKLGFAYLHSEGGRCRAMSARRDKKGRFIREVT